MSPISSLVDKIWTKARELRAQKSAKDIMPTSFSSNEINKLRWCPVLVREPILNYFNLFSMKISNIKLQFQINPGTSNTCRERLFQISLSSGPAFSWENTVIETPDARKPIIEINFGHMLKRRCSIRKSKFAFYAKFWFRKIDLNRYRKTLVLGFYIFLASIDTFIWMHSH